MSKLIEEIFEYKPEEKKLNFKVNDSEKIKNFLLFLKNKDNNEEEKKEILNTLINIFKQCKEISQVIINSPIFKLEENIGLIEILINIFLTSENLREYSKDLLKFLIENINFEKKYYDYIYRKLGEEHRKRSLNPQILLKYMKILLLFYGKDIENKKYFPHKYLFFLNPLNSTISTNITKENKMYLRNNFSIYLSIFIDEYSNNNNSDLIDIMLENNHHLKITLSNNLIKVFYDDNFLDNLEKEIELNKWIIIIFSIEGNKFDKNISMKLTKICCDEENLKSSEKKKMNNKYNGEKKIISISFLRNFKGKLLYIFSPISKIELNFNLVFGNLNKEISQIKGKEFNFLFSPYLFNEKKFEIPSLYQNYKCYLNKPENELYQNYIFDYYNNRKNIFMIGGIKTIIPLFEFLYLFYNTDENKNEENINDEINIEILNDLFELILIIKQNNILNINDSKFFQIISFFLENLPNNILDKSNFIQFLNDLSNYEEEKLNNKKDMNSIYKHIILNLKLIEKLSNENRDKYYSFISDNKFDIKIRENLNFSEILIYLKDYKKFSPIIIEFLNRMYFFLDDKIENNDKRGIIYLYKLLCENYHEEIINLIFKLTEVSINQPDSAFSEIFNEKFRDSLLSFFIQEKRINEKMKMIKLINNLTEKYPLDLNKGNSLEINQLTDFLINYFRIDSFPDNFIQLGKNKFFKNRINNKLNIFFIEWLNIYYRITFINIIDIKKIEEISLIDPYKEYNNDFIFGVLYNIFCECKFSENYADNILKNQFFLNQFLKLIYYQIILYENCENSELKKQINDSKDFTLKKIKLNYGKDFMNNPFKYLKKLLIESYLFSLREENKDIIKEKNSFDLLNQFIQSFKKELFDYILNDIKVKNIKLDDIHLNFSNILKQIEEFIVDYNNNTNIQFKIDFSSDSKQFLEGFVSIAIINKNGELSISNSKEPIYKMVNKLYIFFDIKTLEFICNYFISIFNSISLEQFNKILLILMIPICSNIEKKKSMFGGNNNYSNEIKKKFQKYFLWLLQLIYFKIIKEKSSNKNDVLFTILDIIITKIHSSYNHNPMTGSFLLSSPLNFLNEYINKKIGVRLFYKEQKPNINNNNQNNQELKIESSTNEVKIKNEINTKEIIKKLLEAKFIKKKNEIIFNIPKCKPQQNSDNLLKNLFNKENKEEEIKRYKIDHTLINNKSKEIYNKNQILSIKKIKEYKRIKYDLFTWNGSYSDNNIFYKKEENKKLLFKKSNHLTRDYIQPLIIPMIYSYNFNEFYGNQKFYRNNIKEYYNIPTPNINLNEEWTLNYLPNTIKYECCLLFLQTHFKGNIILKNNYIKFIGNIIDVNKIDEENDKKKKININNKKCYGSIIQSKKNCSYLKLNFKEIKFVLRRRYYDEDYGLELYTNRNKSYYFLFNNLTERNEIINNLKKELPNQITIQSPKIQVIGHSRKKLEINDISLKWGRKKISTLNYLIYLNIFGNRSFRDIQQYPVFPWIITDYEIADKIPKKEEIKSEDIEIIKNKLIEKTIRDFSLPVGLMEINAKGIKRKKSYIETFISSLSTLIEDLKLGKKFPNINTIINNLENDTENQKKENLTLNTPEEHLGMSALNFSDIIKVIDLRKKKENNSIDINEYKFNEDIFSLLKNESNKKNIKLEIIMLPSLFGSHFSNSAYVSHFLTRIFPYSKIAIEIQGNEFDAADRLFMNLEKTFTSVISEKSDVREPIPEFFYFPEMFLNINNLEFGKLQKTKKAYRKSTINITQSLFNINEDEDIKVNNVLLPYWCKNNPYLFITIYREMLENISVRIAPWIDLIFGINANGINAQNHLNLYLRYAYIDVISQEIKDSKNNIDKDSVIKMAELGVNPIQVLFNSAEINCDKNDKNDNQNTLNFLNEKYFTYYSQVLNDNYLIFNQKIENSEINDFLQMNSSIKIISRISDKSILFSGLINGNSYLYTINTKNFKKLKNNQDNSRITAYNIFNPELDVSFLYLGTERGSIIIYIKEPLESEINYYNIIHPHSKEIISINSNINLNMLISSSFDGYIHLYVIPSLKIIRSIYINTNNILIEKVFLSSTPLPCFLLFSNEKQFICYSINGEKLYDDYIEDDFIYPQLFTGNNFIDYLIYNSSENTYNIIIRQFPYMGIVEKFELNE